MGTVGSFLAANQITEDPLYFLQRIHSTDGKTILSYNTRGKVSQLKN